MQSFFSPKDVSDLTGITYRQMQYWDKTNFIKPSYRRKGKYRLYTFADLIQLKSAKGLIDAGRSTQSLRKTINGLRGLLPQLNHPLNEYTILFQGDRTFIAEGQVLMDDISAKMYEDNEPYSCSGTKKPNTNCLEVKIMQLYRDVLNRCPDSEEDKSDETASSVSY